MFGFNRANISNLLTSTAKSLNNPWTVYTGENGENRVLNDDGSNPYVRQINASDDKLLALDDDFSIATNYYQVTLVSETVPSANLQWWISADGGITKQRVTFVKKESRAMRTYWWLILSKD